MIRSIFSKRFILVKNFRVKSIKAIAFFYTFEYTKHNRVARSLLDIGDQAETCAQLFYYVGNIVPIFPEYQESLPIEI